MNKKKILIVTHAMEIGGAESALLGLLGSLDYDKVSVDLFLLRHQGELLPLIPRNVNLLPEVSQYSCLAVPIANVLKKGHFKIAYGRWKGKNKAKKYQKLHKLSNSIVGLDYSHKFTKQYMPLICPDTEYDLAISFLTPHYFVTEKVKAKRKIAWIHTDYSTIDIDTDSELKMWSLYDYIASISDSCTKSFLKIFPSLSSKIILIENIMAADYVVSQSDAYEVTEFTAPINLLSIGRFSEAKNFDNVPDICKKIRQAGLDVKWYLIGYGGDEALIKSKISEAGMEDYVIILGKKTNPYPYIRAFDLYVQPSRYEGKSVTVREAQILHKPVVITNYATSASQLEDGVDGIIVPMDNDACARGIADLLNNPAKMQMLSDNTKTRDYTNAGEVEKIYRLMEI